MGPNPKCGSCLFSEPEVAPEIVFLKAGLIDDKEFMDKVGPPQKHIYCKNFWAWEKPSEGAETEQN